MNRRNYGFVTCPHVPQKQTDMEARVIVTTELQLKAFIADAVSAAFRYYNPAPTAATEADLYGDFKWLQSTCHGVPASTLRIKSAAGEIPGVVKFGKRVLYEKAAVLNWLRSQTRQPINSALIEQQAEEQISQQLGRRGGVRV